MLKKMILMALTAIALINVCELKAEVSIWDTVWVAQEPEGVTRNGYTFSKSGDKFYAQMSGGEYDSYICEFSDVTGEMIRPICHLSGSFGNGWVMSDTNKILYHLSIVDIDSCKVTELKYPPRKFTGFVPHFDSETNCVWFIDNEKGLVRYNLDTKTIVDSIVNIPDFIFMDNFSIYLSPQRNKLLLHSFSESFKNYNDILLDMYDLNKSQIITKYSPLGSKGNDYCIFDSGVRLLIMKSNDTLIIYNIISSSFENSIVLSNSKDTYRNTFIDSSGKYIVTQKYKEPLLVYGLESNDILYYSKDTTLIPNFHLEDLRLKRPFTNYFYYHFKYAHYKFRFNFSDSLLSVNNQEAYKLRVFYTNNLNISYSETEPPQDLFVFDLQGNEVFKKEGIIANNSQFELDLPSGVYFAGVTLNGNPIVKKFIIEK